MYKSNKLQKSLIPNKISETSVYKGIKTFRPTKTGNKSYIIEVGQNPNKLLCKTNNNILSTYRLCSVDYDILRHIFLLLCIDSKMLPLKNILALSIVNKRFRQFLFVFMSTGMPSTILNIMKGSKVVCCVDELISQQVSSQQVSASFKINFAEKCVLRIDGDDKIEQFDQLDKLAPPTSDKADKSKIELFNKLLKIQEFDFSSFPALGTKPIAEVLGFFNEKKESRLTTLKLGEIFSNMKLGRLSNLKVLTIGTIIGKYTEKGMCKDLDLSGLEKLEKLMINTLYEVILTLPVLPNLKELSIQIMMRYSTLIVPKLIPTMNSLEFKSIFCHSKVTLPKFHEDHVKLTDYYADNRKQISFI